MKIGLGLVIEHERYVHERGVSFDRLTQRLADFDIGIAPLADIPFSRARSNDWFDAHDELDRSLRERGKLARKGRGARGRQRRYGGGR